MMLYSLLEEGISGNNNKCIFANWDDEASSYLEIIAESYEIIK